MTTVTCGCSDSESPSSAQDIVGARASDTDGGSSTCTGRMLSEAVMSWRYVFKDERGRIAYLGEVKAYRLAIRCTWDLRGIVETSSAIEVDKTDNEDRGSFAERAVSDEIGIRFGRRGVVSI